MSVPLDAKLLKQFIKLASERLQGDWVILGGTLLPLLDHGYRSTTDIDFVPVGSTSIDQQLKIMEICEELGLPIETANSAALLFLHKIKHFQDHLVPLIENSNTKIYRPSLFLFIQLKLSRLSETDLLDCLAMLQLLGHELKPKEKISLLQNIDKNHESPSTPHAERLALLRAALD